MPWSLLDILLALPAYGLVLFRLGGLMLAAPIFSSRLIPVRVRAALLMTIAAMIFPLIRHQVPGQVSLADVVVGAVGETLIGLAIGLSLAILVAGAEVAGRMVGQQAGIGLGEVIDPTTDEQTSISGQVYAIVLMLVFLIIGGHRATIRALLDTFGVIPVLSYQFDESVLLLLSELLAAAFILGVRLAAPVLIAMFLAELAMGFLTRTMPQLNILSVGFTLRVLIALAAAAFGLLAGEELMVEAIQDTLATIRAAFGLP